MINLLLTNQAFSMIAFSVLCIVISVVTELFKPFIKKFMPTEMFVIVLSVFACGISYCGLVAYFSLQIVWYELMCSIVVGLLVAFITMYGWDKFFDIVNKYKRYLK